MHLKELTVENIQIHKSKTVKFTKGFNVIVGDTGRGKSTLIRALYLLYMNQPRNAEVIFKNKHTKKHLRIKSKDSQGNTLIRHKRKYYLNSPKPLKAFGTKMPSIVSEMYKFKELNWQKQLDPHFLVLQTGGTAAKTLNSSTGMEDQELLMKEIKSRISDHNSNIKRFLKNNQEFNKTIRELKDVTRLFMKAKAIKLLINESSKLQTQIDTLKHILNNIVENRIDENVLIEVDSLLSDIEYIEKLKHQRNLLANDIFKLNSICSKLRESKKVSGTSEIYNKLIDDINHIQVIQKQKLGTDTLIKQLKNILVTIQQSQKDYVNYKLKADIAQKKLDKALIEIGQCPLCGTKFDEKGHVC